MNDYHFKPIDLSEKGINDISNLLTIVYGEKAKLTPEFINWQYNQNPLGKVIGINAWRRDQLVSHYANQPLIACLEGDKIRGLHCINAATHHHHRGNKLFTIITNRSNRLAVDLGYEFLVAVGANESTSAFIKLGAKPIKALDVKIGIGLPDLLDNKAESKYLRCWNKDLLKWRLSNPKAKYFLHKYNDYYFVIGPTGRYGIHAILGYIHKTHLPDNYTLKPIRIYNPLKLWLGLDNNLSWENKFFINFPEQLKPSPLKLIFWDLTGKNRCPGPEQFKFMGIDWDVF